MKQYLLVCTDFRGGTGEEICIPLFLTAPMTLVEANTLARLVDARWRNCGIKNVSGFSYAADIGIMPPDAPVFDAEKYPGEEEWFLRECAKGMIDPSKDMRRSHWQGMPELIEIIEDTQDQLLTDTDRGTETLSPEPDDAVSGPDLAGGYGRDLPDGSGVGCGVGVEEAVRHRAEARAPSNRLMREQQGHWADQESASNRKRDGRGASVSGGELSCIPKGKRWTLAEAEVAVAWAFNELGEGTPIRKIQEAIQKKCGRAPSIGLIDNTTVWKELGNHKSPKADPSKAVHAGLSINAFSNDDDLRREADGLDRLPGEREHDYLDRLEHEPNRWSRSEN